jgi:hypothetical protein
MRITCKSCGVSINLTGHLIATNFDDGISDEDKIKMRQKCLDPDQHRAEPQLVRCSNLTTSILESLEILPQPANGQPPVMTKALGTIGAKEPIVEPTGRERREAQRLMAYWENLKEQGVVTIAGLDLSRTDSREWFNRFLISVDPKVEDSVLLLYGPKFAQLLGLPVQPEPGRPIWRQFQESHVDLFLRRRHLDLCLSGCDEVQRKRAPVPLEGEIKLAGGQIEQYRAMFIPVGVKPNPLTCFALGSFNSRVVEQGMAA